MSGRAAKRMLVLCPYPHGVAAGQRLKFEQYYDDWRVAGWDVEVAPFMDLSLWRVLYERGHLAAKIAGVTKGYVRRLRDLFRLRRYDLIYCHMYVTPLGTSLAERLTRALAPKLVYDVEDNVMAHCRPLRRRPSQSPAPLPSRFRKIQLPGARGRSCRDQLARAQRALQGDQPPRRLHLHLVIGRHRPVSASPSLQQRRACDDRLDRYFQLAPVSRPASRRAAKARASSAVSAAGDRQFRLCASRRRS